ncbi:MAG: PKD domain-containing protein [Cytophagales bacterium]|nr:PKD domain-containing protein [Cytophagales bacterium]
MTKKKLIFKILIFILINICSKSFAQWQTIYYPDSVYTLPVLESVYFVDYNNGMAAGSGVSTWVKAIIIRTKDNGLTWDTVFYSVDSSTFEQITFSNSNTAFAVGIKVFQLGQKGMIARTNDFGNNWDTTITSAKLHSVSFPSDSIGYAVGSGGTVLKTTDAGNNWFTQNSTVNDYLYSVYFLNDTVGFSCGDTFVLKTMDGGNSWSNINIGGLPANGYPYQQVFFSSDSVGYYMRSSDGFITYVYKTIDGGINWNLQSTLPSFENYSAMFFINDTTGYIMGWFSMLKTIDGGASWNIQTSIPGGFWNEMQDVFFLNKDTGFAVGPGMFHKTTIGGECVTPASFSFSDSLLTVSFYDSMFNSTSWYWAFGDGDTSTQQNPIHTYDSAEIYNVCLTATSICDTVTICDSVTVSCLKPISLFSYIDSSLSVSFSDSSTGATSWLWDFDDGDTDTIQNPAHIYQNPGTYTVILIAGNVCGSDTIMRSVTVNALGISESVFNDFKLYPNPNNGNFKIDYQLSKGKKGKLTIFDIMGKKIFTYPLVNETDNLKISKDEVLENGLYFYQIIINNNIVRREKLLIIK